MSRKNANVAEVEATEMTVATTEVESSGDAQAVEATPKAPARRGIWTTHPITGEEISRRDLIRGLYSGEIPQNDVQVGNRKSIVNWFAARGTEIVFQVVFQCTKDMSEFSTVSKGKTSDVQNPLGEGFIKKTELIRMLLKGDESRPGLSKRGVVDYLAEHGITVAYGTVYQICNKLREADPEFVETISERAKTMVAKDKKVKVEGTPEGETPAFEEEATNSEVEALP